MSAADRRYRRSLGRKSHLFETVISHVLTFVTHKPKYLERGPRVSTPNLHCVNTRRVGEVRRWRARAALARLGWRPKTFTPGMLITVTIHPPRDGSNAGHLLTAGLPDGTQMNGGRDHPGLLQQIRQQAAVAESAVTELEKQRLLGCDH
jgi:hypothetical protein